jgi:hypothetical protein
MLKPRKALNLQEETSYYHIVSRCARRAFLYRVDATQKQHIKVHIEVQRTAKTLDQRHRTGLRALSGESRCFLIRWTEIVR